MDIVEATVNPFYHFWAMRSGISERLLPSCIYNTIAVEVSEIGDFGNRSHGCKRVVRENS